MPVEPLRDRTTAIYGATSIVQVDTDARTREVDLRTQTARQVYESTARFPNPATRDPVDEAGSLHIRRRLLVPHRPARHADAMSSFPGRCVPPLRRAATVATITAATAMLLVGGAGPSAARSEFSWPLHPRPHVVRAFDLPEHNWLPGHRGVDLEADPGQTVSAAADGIVVFAGQVAGKPVVSVEHSGGLRTTYEPVEASVTAGRRVGRGDPLGQVVAGHESCPTAACLHWGLRRDRDDYLDPLPLVRRPVIRLHPL